MRSMKVRLLWLGLVVGIVEDVCVVVYEDNSILAARLRNVA